MVQQLKYNVDIYRSTKVINVEGSINVVTSIKLINIVNLLTSQESIVLNLESVELITVAGLESLTDVSMNARETGKRVVLLNAPFEFKKLAESLDYYKFLIFADSLDEAVTKINFFTD